MATPRRANRSAALWGGSANKHLPLTKEDRRDSAPYYNAKPEKRQATTKILKMVLPLIVLSLLAIWLQKQHEQSGGAGRLASNSQQKVFDITASTQDSSLSSQSAEHTKKNDKIVENASIKKKDDAKPTKKASINKDQHNAATDDLKALYDTSNNGVLNMIGEDSHPNTTPHRVSEGQSKKHLILSARAREVEDMLWTKINLEGSTGGETSKTTTNVFDYFTGTNSLPSATTIHADPKKKGDESVVVENDEDEEKDNDMDEGDDESLPPPPKCQLKDGLGNDGEHAAPFPVVLMTLGRSGSSSIWQVMGNLTGLVTPSEELTGSSGKQSKEFFHHIGSNDGGNWAIHYICDKQSQYPEAGIVGFKWKPFGESIFSDASVAALKAFAKSSHPQVKVVRSKRNLLDRAISVYKHRNNDGAPAHCRVGDEECIEKHKLAMKGLEVPVDKLLRQLTAEHEEEERVDQLLKDLNVPHVHVSFEKLYYGDDIASEWMKIFEFLGIGPSAGLLSEEVEAAMEHAATSNPFHNETLANYKEVKKALDGTEFEVLLH